MTSGLGLYTKGNDKGEVNKKRKYKQQQKEASDKETNTETLYIVLKSTIFLGRIMPQRLHGMFVLEENLSRKVS